MIPASELRRPYKDLPRVALHFAALPILLLVFLIGYPEGAAPHQVLETAESEPCPTWFDRAPRLGPGRPDAVELGGLTAVCRLPLL